MERADSSALTSSKPGRIELLLLAFVLLSSSFPGLYSVTGRGTERVGPPWVRKLSWEEAGLLSAAHGSRASAHQIKEN